MFAKSEPQAPQVVALRRCTVPSVTAQGMRSGGYDREVLGLLVNGMWRDRKPYFEQVFRSRITYYTDVEHFYSPEL